MKIGGAGVEVGESSEVLHALGLARTPGSGLQEATQQGLHGHARVAAIANFGVRFLCLREELLTYSKFA